MNEDLVNNPLWEVLVETVHCLPLYRNHKNYVFEVMLSEKLDLKPEELSERLTISLGEALVILEELNRETTTGQKN